MPDGEFGKCVFLNDVTIKELCSALAIHKEFVKARYGSGEGKEAYVDAGDLGAEPEAYAKGRVNGAEPAADNLKRNGIQDSPVKVAAVKAGGVPVDSTGVVTNGVSSDFSTPEDHGLTDAPFPSKPAPSGLRRVCVQLGEERSLPPIHMCGSQNCERGGLSIVHDMAVASIA